MAGNPLIAFKDWRVIAIIAVIVIAVVTVRDWYFSKPALTGESTVYEYMTGSIERVVDWDLSMCNNGVCLLDKDWKCGFWPEDYTSVTGDQTWADAVKKCFDVLVRNAPAYDRIHKLRQICGRRYMTFKGTSDGTSEEICKAAKGKWGQKTIAWFDEDEEIYKDK